MVTIIIDRSNCKIEAIEKSCLHLIYIINIIITYVFDVYILYVCLPCFIAGEPINWQILVW